MRAYKFGASGSNLTYVFHVTCREAGMIIWVQLLGAAPKIWEGKSVQNSARF